MIPHDRGCPPKRERPAGQGRAAHLENGRNKRDNNANIPPRATALRTEFEDLVARYARLPVALDAADGREWPQ